MVSENFGVLNRVRVRKVQQHIPFRIKVEYPPPPPPIPPPKVALVWQKTSLVFQKYGMSSQRYFKIVTAPSGT